MNRYITVDAGTTNTRAFLVENGRIVDRVKIPFGARSSIEGNGELVCALSQAIESLLSKWEICEADVTAIIASGMLTTEFGLRPLDHICAPVGIEDLKRAMHREVFPEISNIPFYLIRGVKIVTDNPLDADMMRGEETEIMGLYHGEYTGAVYVLPGSHSKVIQTDADGKIVSFSTHMTGEMIYALSQHTILKAAVDLSISELDREALISGYKLAKQVGVNKAIFKTRVMKNLYGASDVESYSFFLGAVLCDEIADILSTTGTVIVGGRSQIRSATVEILRRISDRRIIELNDREVDESVALGAVRIFENK